MFRNQLIDLVKHEKIGIIVKAWDIQAHASISSMQFFTNDTKFNNVCKVQAVVTNKLALKLLANFYVEFLKKRSNAKIFNNENDAICWVKDNINSALKS